MSEEAPAQMQVPDWSLHKLTLKIFFFNRQSKQRYMQRCGLLTFSQQIKLFHPKDVLSDHFNKLEAAYHLQIYSLYFGKSEKKEQKMISAIPNINSSKYSKADLSLILQRVITATTRKMYITISRKNFKQDISEQELQTKYVHRHFKCVA